MQTSRLVCFAVAATMLGQALAGCTYLFEDSMKGWVGQPIEDFQKQYKSGSKLVSVTKDEASGKTTYKYSLAGLTDCFVYWIVDARGTIVSWKHEGAGCHSTWP